MFKIRFFTILGIIIFSCSIFVDTANSSMAQNAARAVIKAKNVMMQHHLVIKNQCLRPCLGLLLIGMMVINFLR